MQKIHLEGREFQPGKVVCVGRNYGAHIEEMGGHEFSTEPTIFLKPNSAIVSGETRIFIPECYGILHYEVELCFVVGRECKHIGVDEAVSCISGYAVGIDFTLREMQSKAKKAGGPWSIAKGFDCAAPLGEFITADRIKDPLNLKISLTVNGEMKQRSSTSLMIFPPAGILSYVSQFMTLEEGDVFMTGTPEGVGAVAHGDKIFAEIEGLPSLSVEVSRNG